MTAQEAKACMLLISQLWTNSKTPQNDSEIQLATSAWLTFFASVPYAEVKNVIFEIAASGEKFAPQIGEIFVKLKDKRALPGKKAANEDVYRICCTYAKIVQVPLPVHGTVDELCEWFESIRSGGAGKCN